MKQHITQEQLEELSGENREKIRNFCLSIGQMIEFLNKDRPHGTLIMCTEDIDSNKHGWRVVLQYTDTEVRKYPFIPELCDALWEAVKEVLENED